VVSAMRPDRWILPVDDRQRLHALADEPRL
jgi:hypothetical protein